ncbi:ribosome maturation factor RimM, partial [Propionibacterium freudenreichii]|nr:ribosome maturation factor RimM [Propionibacterium freudenreichii]
MDTVEVVVAVIGRAHGVRGELTLTVRTDEPDRRLRKGVRLRASDPDRSFVVESARWVSG